MNMLLYYNRLTGDVDRIFWIESYFNRTIESNYLAETHDYLIAPSVPDPKAVYTDYLLHVDPVTKEITQKPMPPREVVVS